MALPAAHEALLEAARAVRRNAHAPHSDFRVGAALISASGRIYTGCNFENSSYGLTVCAERHSLHAAVAAGDPGPFLRLAVVTGADSPVYPCGACRQVLAELCGGDLEIICANLAGEVATTTLGDLLPHAFRLGPARRLEDRP